MHYFEKLRMGSPSCKVIERGPQTFLIESNDVNDNKAMLVFQNVVHDAMAHADDEWEVRPSPPYTQRPIPGWSGTVHSMAAIWRVIL